MTSRGRVTQGKITHHGDHGSEGCGPSRLVGARVGVTASALPDFSQAVASCGFTAFLGRPAAHTLSPLSLKAHVNRPRTLFPRLFATDQNLISLRASGLREELGCWRRPVRIKRKNKNHIKETKFLCDYKTKCVNVRNVFSTE